MTKHISHLGALGIAIFGFVVWVLSDSCMKLAGEAGLPPYEVVGFFGLFGVLLMFLKAWPEGKIRALWPRHPRSQLTRALICCGIGFFNTIALKHLPLTLFYVTAFTTPLVIAILAFLVLHERLTLPKVLAVIAGFVGVVIAINPTDALFAGDWIGYGAIACAVLFSAVNAVWLRVMTQSETVDSLTFFTALTEMVLGGLCMLGHWEPVTIHLLLILFGMGALGILGNICNYIAIKHIRAATVWQFHYTQIITGAIVAYFVWHEIPTAHLYVGIAVITGAGLYVASHMRRPDNITAPTPH